MSRGMNRGVMKTEDRIAEGIRAGALIEAGDEYFDLDTLTVIKGN